MSNIIKGNVTGQGKMISIRMLHTSEEENGHDKIEFIYNDKIEEAMSKAETILEQAKREAQQIRDNLLAERKALEEEKQRIYKEAHEAGYEEGFRQGELEGLTKMKEQIDYAKSILQDAKIEYNKIIESSEETILSIGLKAAEKIVRTSLNENKELFIPLVKKAIQEVKEYKNIQVYVHPNYYKQLVSQKDELLSHYFHDGQVVIFPNEDQDETSCIIETEGGRIDASVDSQFQELREKLFELFLGDKE